MLNSGVIAAPLAEQAHELDMLAAEYQRVNAIQS